MKYTASLPVVKFSEHQQLARNGWVCIKEPSSFKLVLAIAVPIMVLVVCLQVIIAYALSDQLRNFIKAGETQVALDLRFLGYLLIIGLSFAVHEVLHAVVLPSGIRGSEVLWGFRSGSIFVYSESTMSRRRFLLVCLTPYLVFSLLLPLCCWSLGILHPLVIWISIIQAGGSGVDILNTALVLKQIPKGAIVKNLGGKTYYKLQDKNKIEPELNLG